jgi:hypothetical protein
MSNITKSHEVRQDSLTPVRIYARGLIAGHARAHLQIDQTLQAEARCLVALEHLGITGASRWAIMEAAQDDARIELDATADDYAVRHYAALLVLAWLRLICRRRTVRP